MKKIRIFFDPRKEEKWLNSMIGYKLEKVGLITYYFKKTSKQYHYSVNYTPSKIEYLKLINNLKSNVKEIQKHHAWTYIEQETNAKNFYRNSSIQMDNLKLFVTKYSLYSRAYLMFGLAFLFLTFTLNKYFIICSIILLVLSYLYYACIKETKKNINNK